MSSKEDTIVYIEHCINCNTHAWCTNHNESKYSSYGLKVKDAVEKNYPNF